MATSPLLWAGSDGFPGRISAGRHESTADHGSSRRLGVTPLRLLSSALLFLRKEVFGCVSFGEDANGESARARGKIRVEQQSREIEAEIVLLLERKV